MYVANGHVLQVDLAMSESANCKPETCIGDRNAPHVRFNVKRIDARRLIPSSRGEGGYTPRHDSDTPHAWCVCGCCRSRTRATRQRRESGSRCVARCTGLLHVGHRVRPNPGGFCGPRTRPHSRDAGTYKLRADAPAPPRPPHPHAQRRARRILTAGIFDEW